MREHKNMALVHELIAKQRETNRPKEPQRAPAPAPEPADMSQLRELIAAARLARQNRWDPCPVTIAGEGIDVEIGQTLTSDDWEKLTRAHPVTLKADGPYLYDRGEVAKEYPLDRLRIEGENPDSDTWLGLLSVLSPDDQLSVEAVMWWMHVGEPQQKAKSLNPHLREATAALAVARGDTA